MFGKSIGKAALEYFDAFGWEKEQMRNILLKDPIKATAFLLLSGAYALSRFSQAKLTTPYRKAPPSIYQDAMSLAKKITDEIIGFVVYAGGDCLREVCFYLRSDEAPTAILASMVLLNFSDLSDEILSDLDYSLHHMSGNLSEYERACLGGLIICVEAQNGIDQAYTLLEREVQRRGMYWREAAQNFIATGLDYLFIPGKPTSKHDSEDNSSSDDGPDFATNAYYTYYNFWDPSSAPWNNE
jgi:hypothetical protein